MENGRGMSGKSLQISILTKNFYVFFQSQVLRVYFFTKTLSICIEYLSILVDLSSFESSVSVHLNFIRTLLGMGPIRNE